MKTQHLNPEKMKPKEVRDFSYSFESSKPATEIFNMLLNPKKWWTGFYEETITGKSENIGDEFEFFAGRGVHYSKHRLVEIIPNLKIVWEVTDSTLSFLTKTDEWIGTKVRFDLKENTNCTTVTFTHQGLTPKFECYGDCSGAWTEYLKSLEKKLK